MLLARGLRLILGRVPTVRLFGPSVTLVGLLAVVGAVITGKIDLSQFDSPVNLDELASVVSQGGGAANAPEIASNTTSHAAPPSHPNQSDQLAPARPGAPDEPPPSGPLGGSLANSDSGSLLDRGQPRSETRLRIATFNIQRFGEKKASMPEVMQHIAQIVASFDLVAIQEVQSPQAMPIARLVDLINRSGGRYDATVSEPIGRSTYREQYAFIWDATRIQMIPQSAYVVRDDQDRMSRPPMVASFEARIAAVAGRQPLRLTVINVHTDPNQVSPSQTDSEMNVLDDVFLRVRQYEYQTRGIKNVLIAGDLNANTAQLGELGQIEGMHSVVGTTPTNLAGTKTYDHILFDRNVTSEYTGVFGVIDLEQDFGLTPQQAALVSDHRPVWAEFSAYEMPPLINRNPTTTARY